MRLRSVTSESVKLMCCVCAVLAERLVAESVDLSVKQRAENDAERVALTALQNLRGGAECQTQPQNLTLIDSTMSLLDVAA